MLMPGFHQHEQNRYLRAYLRTGDVAGLGGSRNVEALRKDGSQFPVELAVSEFLMENDGRRHFTAVVSDVGHRFKEDQTQAVLAALFEATPDCVGIADAKDGHFLFQTEPRGERCGWLNWDSSRSMPGFSGFSR